MSDLLDTGIQMSPMYLPQCGTITPFYVDPFSHDSHLSFSFKGTNPSNGKNLKHEFYDLSEKHFISPPPCYSEQACWVGFGLILQEILTAIGAIRPLFWKMLGGLVGSWHPGKIRSNFARNLDCYRCYKTSLLENVGRLVGNHPGKIRSNFARNLDYYC